MKKLMNFALTCKIWKDTQGQDLMEYALLGGLLASAFVAIMPGLAGDLVALFGKLIGMLQAAGMTDGDSGAARS